MKSNYKLIHPANYTRGRLQVTTADTLERTLLPEGFVTACDNIFHAYIPDYQGNIVGVYNSSTNTLEQFTDYYPYGLPHASATSPTVNRRKYGAKELTTANGLNLYDFAARFQNPAFPAFTTPDPLAENKYGFSSYLFCSDDPINFVDPTGLDEYEIDESGNFINRIKNEDYDVVRVVDSDGNKLSESDHYQYGSLDAHMSNKYQPDIGTATIYSYFIINDFTITRSLFEFLAAYTNVEWTHCEYNDENGQNFNILSTSHFRSRNNSFNCFLREPNNNVKTIKHMAHNHPSGFPIPSGMHNQSGDITEAKKMDKRNKHYPIQYEVYSAKFQIYVPYSAKSIPEDFLYVLSIIQWLNPQFIELLKR